MTKVVSNWKMQKKCKEGICMYQLIQSLSKRHVSFFENNLPRIIHPHKTVLDFEKRKLKKIIAENKIPNTPVVISCKNTKLNHHLNQRYPNFDPNSQLCTRGWKRVSSRNDFFIIKPHKQNPAVRIPEDALHKSFDDLSVKEEFVCALQNIGIKQPTNVQRKAIPYLLNGESVVIASETGSGKTYAYLLPLIQNISEMKTQESSLNSTTCFLPRVVILVPTRELAVQVQHMASSLMTDNQVKIKVLAEKIQTEDYDSDIVISTPGKLLKVLKQKKLMFSQCLGFVLDEADTLLDDTFNDEVREILSKHGLASGFSEEGDTILTQLVFVSATMPRDLQNILHDIVDTETLHVVHTEGLHLIMPHIHQKFIRLQPTTAPVEIVKQAQANTGFKIPTMIFTNKTSSCVWLHKYLQESGVKTYIAHGKQDRRERAKVIQNFIEKDEGILVCTDVCSRGINSMKVEQVINYEFPLFISDYIHRAGRVGRVGSKNKCKVISYAVKPWDVDLVRKIEMAVRFSERLPNVNANIKRKRDSIVYKKYGPPEKEKETDEDENET